MGDPIEGLVFLGSSGTGLLPSGRVDLTGDEDPTDEDGDFGIGNAVARRTFLARRRKVVIVKVLTLFSISMALIPICNTPILINIAAEANLGKITVVTLVEEQMSSWNGNLPRLPIRSNIVRLAINSIVALEVQGNEMRQYGNTMISTRARKFSISIESKTALTRNLRKLRVVICKAGLKDDMDARSNVYVLSNGCRKSSDDSHDYYWEYAPGMFIHLFLYIDGMVFFCGCKAEIWVTKGLMVKAKGNVLGMEIVRDQSGDYDVEKNGKWSYIYAVGSQEYQVVCTRPDIASVGVDILDGFDRRLQINVQVFMDFDYAIRRSITLKGLLTELGYELRLVAGIATGALVKGCSRSEVPAQVKLNRRTFNNQILLTIKDEGAFSTMHTLLTSLQTVATDQVPVVAGLHLQLDLLVGLYPFYMYYLSKAARWAEPRKITSDTILALQGRFSSSGKPFVRTYLLKCDGFDKSYRSTMGKEQLAAISVEVQETMVCFNVWVLLLVVAGTYDYLYKPCPEQPPEDAAEDAKSAWKAEYKIHYDVACLMLGRMSPALQRQSELFPPQAMLNELKKNV
ncbi:hypothetical protein Tco_0597925 [Tanacetum coccineum]